MKPDTKAIRARADAATAGPWHWSNRFLWGVAPNGGLADVVNAWASSDGESGLECEQSDKDFIAAARADVPALCDRVEALERALRRIRDGDYPTDPHGHTYIARAALEGE